MSVLKVVAVTAVLLVGLGAGVVGLFLHEMCAQIGQDLVQCLTTGEPR